MKTFLLTLSALILSTLAAPAQDTRGTITGHVTDSSGALVAGAEVRATNRQTNTVTSAKSNEAGVYTLPYLLPGTYDLNATFTGFKQTDRKGIEVRVND